MSRPKASQPPMTRRIISRIAASVVTEARAEAYLQGLRAGRAERPMTCGLSAEDHCVHSYMNDPGQ